MDKINIKATDFNIKFSCNKKLKFMASLNLFKKEQIKKIIENNKNNFRVTRSGVIYNHLSNMATRTAENISCYKINKKAKKKNNQKNPKIKYSTKLQNKHLTQHDLEETKVKKQQIKNIKTKVKKQLKTKLNRQQSITDEPIVSIMNKVNETTTFRIISPQEKLKVVVGPGLLPKEQSNEKNENVKSMLHKKNEIYSKVIMLANEDKTKQSNHDQSSSDTTHLIIPKLCLWVPYDEARKIQTAIMNLVKRVCILTTDDETVTDIFDFKRMNELKSILPMNKKLETIQCQLHRIQKMQKFYSQKTGVPLYQLIFDKNKKPQGCLVNSVLQRHKNMNIPLPLQLKKYCDDIKIRCIGQNKLKLKELENIKLMKHEKKFKKNEEKQLLTDISLPPNKNNIFTTDSSIGIQSDPSILTIVATTTPSLFVKSTAVMESNKSLTASITTMTRTGPVTKTVLTTSEQAPLMTITAPIEKTMTPTVLSMEKEDEKSTLTTTVLSNQKRQSKCLDEHSSASKIDMLQAFRELKKSLPKNRNFIFNLLLLEFHRSRGDFIKYKS